ncbi:MAG: prepilin-type N-terminal cleavage/methylation domain-containing protein [Candidatus Methylomirabilis oxyfera]|nr:prepilin-type N-terminal cleavage/methylation domain-containing protein [Candidatus Methylomirabilis oxyfera]
MFGRFRKEPGGFSLIELLIVMAIIAILAAIAIPNLLTAQTKAKVSKALAESKLIVTQTQLYNADKNAYPTNVDTLRSTNYISKTVDPFTTTTGTNYGYSPVADMNGGHVWALSVGPGCTGGGCGTAISSFPAGLDDGISGSGTCAGEVGWSSSYGAIQPSQC